MKARLDSTVSGARQRIFRPRLVAGMWVFALALSLFLPTLAVGAPNSALFNDALKKSTLRAEPVITSGTENQLFWTRPEVVDGYEIEVALDDKFRPNHLTASVAVPYTTDRYTFGGLKVGTTYYYRVRSVKAGRKGPWSEPCRSIQERSSSVNVAPKSRPGHEYRTEVGSPIVLDGSLSFDVDGFVVRYDWDFDGDGVWDYSSPLPAAVTVFRAADNYRTQLRVTDNEGKCDVHWTWVRVLTDITPPVARFSGPAEAIVNESVTLDASASYDPNGAVVSYSWDFEADGAYDLVTTDRVITRAWATPGEWVVVLDVRDAFGNVGSTTGVVIVKTQSDVAPDLPANVVAVDTPNVEGGSVTVTWDANTEDDLRGYRVRRALSGDGPFELVGDSADTFFIDHGLTDGVRYYYAITAYDAAGLESEYSVLASAVAADSVAPAAPAAVTAADVAGDESGAVVIAWSASETADTVGYRLYRDGVEIADTTGLTYTDTGLTEGATYRYTVAAYDEVPNLGEQSEPAAASPADDVAPTAPTGLTAADTQGDDGGSVDLAWTASASGDVVSYTVYRNGQPLAAGITGRTYTDTTADLGVTYVYAVTATDDAGNESEQSAPADGASRDDRAPVVPTGLTVTPVPAGGALELAWDPIADAEKYTVYRDGVFLAHVTGAPALLDEGLTNGTTYSYTVSATDAAGNVSHECDPVEGTPVDTVAPAVPAGLTAADVAPDEGGVIAVEWNANTDDTVGYKLYRDGVEIADTTGLSYTDTGRTDRVTYRYTVAAYDLAGNTSAPSGAATAASRDDIAPQPPSGLAVTDHPDDEGYVLDLAWGASPSGDVVAYEIVRDGAVLATVSGASYVDLGAGRNERTYAVAAIDGGGNKSAATNPVTARPIDNTPPPKVTQVKVRDIPNDNGGWLAIEWYYVPLVDLARYEVYCDGRLLFTTTSPSWAFEVPDGADHEFYVVAVDTSGLISVPSEVVVARAVDNIVPVAVAWIDASDTSGDNGGSISVSWAANNIEPDLAGYTVSCYDAADALVSRQVLTGRQTAFTGLTNGAWYTFTVVARDRSGNSSPSAPVAGASASDDLVPAIPTGLTAAINWDLCEIDVNWDDNTDPDLAVYRVFRATGSGAWELLAETSVSEYVDVHPTVGQQYRYRVQAVDAAGNVSFFSDEAAVDTTDENPPTVPTGLVVTGRTSSSISLTWAESTDDCGAVSYRIERRAAGAGAWQAVGTAESGIFTDSGLPSGRTYDYRVKAVDMSANSSDWSEEIMTATLRLDSARYENTHASIAYTAGWFVAQNFYYQTYASGDSVNLTTSTLGGEAGVTSATFTFEGTQVTWLGIRASNRGIAAVYLDGVLIRNVDCYKPSPVWPDDYEYQAPLYTSPILPYGNHTIKIVYTGIKNAAAEDRIIDIDAFDVVTSQDVDAPATPASVMAVPTQVPEGGAATLSWTANAESDLGGYRVYRSTALDGPYATVATLGKVSTWNDTGLNNGTTYYYHVAAFDGAGNMSTRSVPVACTPFAAPTGLGVTDQPGDEGTALVLSWNPSPEPSVVGYRIFRSSSSGGTYGLVGTVEAETTYVDGSLPKLGTGYYKVAAIDAAGNQTALSPVATATAVDDLAPQPSIMTGVQDLHKVAGGAVAVTWTSVTAPDLAGYKVYRAKAPEGTYAAVATLGKVTSWTDTGLIDGVSYNYAVTAFDSSNNESAMSAGMAGASTSAPATNLSARTAPYATGVVGLVWSPSTGSDLTGYRVYRSDSADGPFAPVATLGKATVYSDGGLVPGQTYRYKVAALGASGSLSPETEVVGVTVAETATAATRFENTDPAVVFTSGWVLASNFYYVDHASDGSVKLTTSTLGGVAGVTSATFTFEGSYVTWLGIRASNRGIAAVYIDGVLMGNVDCYKPSPVWPDDYEYQAPVYTSPVLPYGQHTIRIVYTGTKNAAAEDRIIDIDAFDVYQ